MSSPSARNLLFVDDEPTILGIYQMLGALLDESYSIQTASSGREGLARIGQTRFDAVISDLMMPEMTGAEFLTEVARMSPSSARVVVSGFADELTTVKCLMVGHRYFTKPFSPVALTAAIRTLCEAEDFMIQEKMRSLVGKLDSLPIPSQTYLQLTKSLNTSCPIFEISQIVEQDLALTAKVLQTVNSAMFGAGQRVTQISHAIQLIGLNVLRALVLSIHVFDLFRNVCLKNFLHQLWSHSLRIATDAKRIAVLRQWPAEIHDETFLAGLLHDIGKVVFAASEPDVYHTLHTRFGKDAQQLCAAESDLFGGTHADCGAYLLRLWGIPDSISDAVRIHHSLSASELQYAWPAVAVHAAHNEFSAGRKTD